MGRFVRPGQGKVQPVEDEKGTAMGRHRRTVKRAGRPVRTGLLGASAAMAVGAVAVASGLLPGGDTFTVGGESSPSGPLYTDGPAKLQTQGEAGAESATGASPATPTAPHSPSTSPSPRTAKPSTKPPAETKTPEKTASRTPEKVEKPSGAPRSTAPSSAPPVQRNALSPSSSEQRMEAEVLALVNEERAKAGCSPVRYDAALARLAGDFSADMADRGFFDHTDPDGRTPWDRAKRAGVKNLGGENIARGQADAAAVMNSWMNSEGHRANILNCDYKTLGVGVHLGSGGPWWTQNFGF
ncbi:CAP domain-containing protein [Streptomyces sp. NPDC004609]|uniref:CAP domain-containing protein n=1 Tax=Streptomyces sp. NPDC004609 TaxID=3364704 RepID=UPI0036B95DE2